MTNTNMKANSILLLCVSMLVMISACTTRSITSEPSEANLPVDSGLMNHASFPIGTAIDIKKLLNDEKLKALTIANFNSITATNDMKIYRLRPKEEVFNWSRVDTLVAFCEANNMRLFGHNLLWHHGVPQWIVDKTDANGDA